MSAWARTAAAATLVLGTALGGLTAAGSAHADTPDGVSIDLGGAGGDGFIADAYGTGGRPDTIPAGTPSLPNFGRTVAHPIPASIWDTSRVGESHYTIPGLTAGATYQARLYFMDWYYSRPGERKFDVSVNGTRVLTDFDIIGTAVAAGADGQEAFGVEEDVTATADSSGVVTLDFDRGSANQPQVNAIVLAPGE
ncbi:malectin domain-containing carbohydrate-binding protein [Actinacidiphila sp. DG2A-62]|uniref:malectin domain-containing carbohydrate-binding protein n=1 Tax=Actinacidiphila sp. DG2A-62 TaxID=3108821 RepID=UPI002DB77C12|nr:malectin domain-containing carbohydrate-binding protein [Actinacidiphila sp. DG2A-62]MEC3993609.1 malectin domain-containing carbohydrate-binding protein [Actinacidiphila sp. DG2A-62]